MKKFQFRLESLLKYREYLEHKKKLEVASAVSRVNTCENVITGLKENLKHAVKRLSFLAETGISGRDLMRYTEYMSTLDIEIDIRYTELKMLTDKLAERKKELQKKSIDKRVIENLKDLKKDEYTHEVNLMIQKESDDMVSIRRTGEHVKS